MCALTENTIAEIRGNRHIKYFEVMAKHKEGYLEGQSFRFVTDVYPGTDYIPGAEITSVKEITESEFSESGRKYR